MNRLQKKCFIGATGMHLLLVVILFVGPAFIRGDKVDDSEVITFIPDLLTDKPFSNPGATTSRPAPQQQPQPQPQAQPQPQPQVEPPTRQPEPPPQPVRDPDPPKVATPKVNKPDPDSLEPDKDKKPTTRQVQVSDKVVKLKQPPKTTTTSKSSTQTAANNERQRQVANAVKAIRGNVSTTTKVEMPEGPGGGSGVSYANYAQEVRRVYTEAVRIPPEVEDDQAVVEVRVTIARAGTVVSSSITKPSGSPVIDRAIQAALDRVNFVAPFPQGAKESQRTFIISFDLKARKLIG